MLPQTPTVTAHRAALRTALDSWRDERVTLGTKLKNAKKQAGRLRTMFDAEGWTDWPQLTREGIVGHIKKLGVSPKTVETLLSQLTQFCAWAKEAGHLHASPCDGIRSSKPRKRRSQGITNRRGMRALTDQQYEALYAAAVKMETADKPRFQTPVADLYEVARWTGGRCGQLTRDITTGEDGAVMETTGIRWRDVCLDAPGYVIYDGEDGKNGSGWKIPLHPRARAALLRWRERCSAAGPDDLVFNFRFQDRWFNAHMGAAGIPKKCPITGRCANFHSIRKTFCTSLVVAGVAPGVAQRLMQHMDIQTTMKVYAEVREEHLELGINLLPDSAPQADSKESSPITPKIVLTDGRSADILPPAMLPISLVNEATRPGTDSPREASLQFAGGRVRTTGLVDATGGDFRPSTDATRVPDSLPQCRGADSNRPSRHPNAVNPDVTGGCGGNQNNLPPAGVTEAQSPDSCAERLALAPAKGREISSGSIPLPGGYGAVAQHSAVQSAGEIPEVAGASPARPSLSPPHAPGAEKQDVLHDHVGAPARTEALPTHPQLGVVASASGESREVPGPASGVAQGSLARGRRAEPDAGEAAEATHALSREARLWWLNHIPENPRVQRWAERLLVAAVVGGSVAAGFAVPVGVHVTQVATWGK